MNNYKYIPWDIWYIFILKHYWLFMWNSNLTGALCFIRQPCYQRQLSVWAWAWLAISEEWECGGCRENTSILGSKGTPWTLQGPQPAPPVVSVLCPASGDRLGASASPDFLITGPAALPNPPPMTWQWPSGSTRNLPHWPGWYMEWFLHQLHQKMNGQGPSVPKASKITIGKKKSPSLLSL